MLEKIKLYFVRLFDKEIESIIKTLTKMDSQLDAYVARKQAASNDAAKAARDWDAESKALATDADAAKKIRDNLRANIFE